MIYYRYYIIILVMILGLSVSGCQSQNGDSSAEKDNTEGAAAQQADQLPNYYQAGITLTPEASGDVVEENDDIIYDLSHVDQGYMMVQKKADLDKMILQLTGNDNITYTYYIHDDSYAVIPFTAGDGKYQATAYLNIDGNQYIMSLDKTVEVKLENEVIPFLYPSQYVDFDESMKSVALAKKLTEGKEQLDAVNEIFKYVTEHISYDYEKAENVQSGYLPVIDQTLEEGKGICFDYSALMTSMLRSVGIPTRLDIGYSQDVYHAWISVYFDEKGWVNNMVQFDGEQWSLMDPTLASTSYDSGEEYQIVQDNYSLEYVH